ncbi:unnamed protein product [Gordionus sp. m RMFG-2023]
MGTLCSERSVAIISGTMHTFVNTIAHEIGHNFGLNHDEPYRCGYSHIMAPMYRAQTTWSSCTKNELRSKIHNYRCLQPEHDISNDIDPAPKYRNSRTKKYEYNFDYSRKIPEDNFYNLTPDAACEIRFGKNYRHYGGPSLHANLCTALLCYNPNINGFPLGDQAGAPNGTICGVNKMCSNGKCGNTYKRPRVQFSYQLLDTNEEKSSDDGILLLDEDLMLNQHLMNRLQDPKKRKQLCLSLCINSGIYNSTDMK